MDITFQLGLSTLRFTDQGKNEGNVIHSIVLHNLQVTLTDSEVEAQRFTVPKGVERVVHS